MNLRNLPAMFALYIGVMLPSMLQGQASYVKQIVTGNGGKFEYTPPFQDFVTIQTYNPAGGVPNIVHTIFTQSVQDICISGNSAYIAAQDSIVKIDLNTYQRIASIADSGLSKLYLSGDKLFVSKQYPLTTFFVEVLDTADLSLVSSIPGISGDCGNMVLAGDSLYVAVSGGWMGTEGKIAVIETNGYSLVREINLGTGAVGTLNIYKYNDKLYTVNKSPYMTPDAGSITTYNLADGTYSNTLINKNVGAGAGICGHLLFFGLDYGIGSFNMNSLSVQDTVIVPDPGSTFFRFITSAAIDTLNDRIFVNSGDYFTPGSCLVSTLAGDSVASYATGISTEAVAVDYRKVATGFENQHQENARFSMHPNPATHWLTIQPADDNPLDEIAIFDRMGRIVFHQACTDNTKQARIAIASWPSGIYIVKVRSAQSSFSGKFLKQD